MTAPSPTLADWLTNNFPTLSAITPLAAGGQKQVLAAVDSTHGEVVLKLIRPPVDHEATRREIVAVQSIASPLVPAILRHGVTPSDWGDIVWLIEQRVAGITLRQVVASGPVVPREGLRIARDILGPLAAAESARIVHRDVKPDNIIRATDGSYWLLDFGLARHLGMTSLTATALPWGKLTVGYAPSEQFRNNKPAIDARCDLFALGVTLYECLTGQNPYYIGATGPLDILRRVERVGLTPLSLGMATSPAFEEFIVALTQRRREHRPRTASEALDWVKDICSREGV